MNFRTPANGFNSRWDPAEDRINELEDHYLLILKSFEVKTLSGERINKFIKEICSVKIFNMGVQREIIGQKQNMWREMAMYYPKLVKTINYVKPKQDKCWGKPYIRTLISDCWKH